MSFLNSIEDLSKSVFLHRGDFQKFVEEVLIESASALECARTNVWLFNAKRSSIINVLAYDAFYNNFYSEKSIKRQEIPNYFKFLERDEIIVANDALNYEVNKELLDSYIIPNKITSMMDVPIRFEGKMIGVVCFEHIDKPVEWTDADINFSQSISHLLSLCFGTNNTNQYKQELENMVSQKEVLLREINHRVKNNLSVILGLLNTQKTKTRDSFHLNLFKSLAGKVYAISSVQNQLQNNANHNKIDFCLYLQTLSANLITSYEQDQNIKLIERFDKVELPIDLAIPLGLISNEILTNSLKYAFLEKKKNKKIHIELKKSKTSLEIQIKDNGSGFDLGQKIANEGMGLELIYDLAEQIDAIIDITTVNGTTYSITLGRS